MSRLIIIIPAALQTEANHAASILDPIGGEETFTVPLWDAYKDPSVDPPSHYWCSGQSWTLGEAQVAFGPLDATIEEWQMEAAPAYPETLLGQLGLIRRNAL